MMVILLNADVVVVRAPVSLQIRVLASNITWG
jgi:hypothetical protein